LVLGIFSDEKPPRGICGFIDWRLNGMISREIKQGRITGDFMEKILIPFPRRIGTEMLFLFGLGKLSDTNYDRIYTAARHIAGTVDTMLINNFSFDLPGVDRSDLTCAGTVEAMVTGFFDFLSEDVNKLSSMTSCIVTSPAKVKEVSLGIKNFKTNVRDLGSIDVSALQNCFA
jgi:Cytosol aminopeptidase family, N-terminal domain.